MFKKVLLGLGAIVVLALIVGALFLSNLDSIVQAAVEKYGSEAAGATVELADVELSPSSGMGKLSGLRIQNPEGFELPDAFFLGMIDVQVDMDSVAGDGPIVINKIIIDKPQVTFEVNKAGASNLQEIAGNAQQYAGGSASKSKESGQAKVSEESPSEAGRKVIVKLLTVSGGAVTISHSMLKDKKMEATIPTFSLRDLGADKGGMLPAELAGKLLAVITQKSSVAASKSFVKGLGIFSAVKGSDVQVNTGSANVSIDKDGVNIKGLFSR